MLPAFSDMFQFQALGSRSSGFEPFWNIHRLSDLTGSHFTVLLPIWSLHEISKKKKKALNLVDLVLPLDRMCSPKNRLLEKSKISQIRHSFQQGLFADRRSISPWLISPCHSRHLKLVYLLAPAVVFCFDHVRDPKAKFASYPSCLFLDSFSVANFW